MWTSNVGGAAKVGASSCVVTAIRSFVSRALCGTTANFTAWISYSRWRTGNVSAAVLRFLLFMWTSSTPSESRKSGINYGATQFKLSVSSCTADGACGMYLGLHTTRLLEPENVIMCRIILLTNTWTLTCSHPLVHAGRHVMCNCRPRVKMRNYCWLRNERLILDSMCTDTAVSQTSTGSILLWFLISIFEFSVVF